MTTPPPRYLLEGRALQDFSSTRGIGTYLGGLLDGMAELGADDRFDLLLRRGPRPEIGTRWRVGFGPTVPVLKRRLQPVVDPLLLTAALLRHRAALYHSVEWGQPLAARMPVVLTVHDVVPFVFPDDYKWMRRERIPALRLARRADALITDSAVTAADLIRLGGVDPARITVVHLGVDTRFAPADPESLAEVRHRLGLPDKPLVLTVAVFDARKRLGTLTDAVRRIRADHDVHLVIAGEQGVFSPRVRAGIDAAGLSAHTSLPGYVKDADLIALYGASTCLLFTSAYEGFGLPVLEAMSCGCPVIAFDNSTMPEIAAPAAVIVPDGDGAAMAAAAGALLSDPAAAARRGREGRSHAAAYTWERCARETLAVYDRVLGGPAVTGR
jgi:glycosyltransferase involved in cell wall biosynthesis